MLSDFLLVLLITSQHILVTWQNVYLYLVDKWVILSQQTQSNIQELVIEMHSNQSNFEKRVNKIEEKLAQLQVRIFDNNQICSFWNVRSLFIIKLITQSSISFYIARKVNLILFYFKLMSLIINSIYSVTSRRLSFLFSTKIMINIISFKSRMIDGYFNFIGALRFNVRIDKLIHYHHLSNYILS